MAGVKNKKMSHEKKMTHVPRLVVVERDPLISRLSCPLCKEIFEEATTVTLCLHTFCRKCIVEKLQEEENCPVCDVHLGVTPSEKLRPDHNIQALRAKLFPPENNQRDASQSVPHEEPVVVNENTDQSVDVSIPEVNDSPYKPVQNRRRRKKGGKKGSAHRGPGPVIKEPVAGKEGKVEEENEPATNEVESSHEEESSDKSDLVKPLKSLGLEPTGKSGTDIDAKGKGVEISQPTEPIRESKDKSKGKGKDKKKEKHDVGSSSTTGTMPSAMSGTVAGTGTRTLTGQPERKFTNVWFSLVASHEPNGAKTLPQISPNIIRIKDGNKTVSSVQKYLAHKLNLSNESEVELMCQNLRVSPAVSMYNLLELWLQTRPKQKIRTAVGQSAEKFVMVLNYKRA